MTVRCNAQSKLTYHDVTTPLSISGTATV